MIISIKYKDDLKIDFEIDEQDLHLVIGVRYMAAQRGDKFYLFNRETNKYFHRIVMGEPSGLVVDHIDGNPQNNKRDNLRVCKAAENLYSQAKPKNNKTGYKGVSLCKTTKRYKASIGYQGKCLNLGRYKTIEEAALVYNNKALELFGEYAKLNDIK